MCLLLNTSTLMTEFRHPNLGKQILTVADLLFCATHMFECLLLTRLSGKHNNEWDKVHSSLGEEEETQVSRIETSTNSGKVL